MVLGDYFKQIEQFQKGLSRQMAPMNQVLAGIKSFEDQLKASVRIPDLKPYRFSLPPEFSEVQNRIGKITEQVTRAIEPFNQALKDLPPRTKEALLRLAEFGWFIDPEMPLSQAFGLDRAVSQGDLDAAERELVEYYEVNLDTIRTRLSKRCPSRAHLFEAAFKAHLNEDFVLSIPVFLAQADGICKERIDFCFFRTRHGRPATAEYVDGIPAESYTAAALSPLTQKFELHTESKPETDAPGEFKRHAIMHGNSTDYGTKVNSLKAISLLSYVESVLDAKAEERAQPET